MMPRLAGLGFIPDFQVTIKNIIHILLLIINEKFAFFNF